MNYYKRGNVWWIRFTQNGKEIRMSCGCDTKKAAVSFVERMHLVRRTGSREAALAMVDIFFPPDRPAGVPLSEAWDRYMDVARSTGMDRAADRTLKFRRQSLARLVKWIGEESPRVRACEEVDGPLAGAFAAHLASCTSKLTKKPMSEKSRANVIGELSTIWQMLGKVSASVSNPWDGLSPRVERKNRRPAFSREQEAAVMAAAAKVGKGWPLACLIARHTGLRYGDVANLEWADVDMDAGTIGHADSGLVLQKTKRHRITVLLPMSPALRAAFAAIPPDRRTGHVLPNHAALYGHYVKSAYSALNFREVLNLAGVGPEWDFHSWRHTFRSRLADAGVDIETAKRLCGHTQDETSRHYDHASHLAEYKKAIDAAATV